MTEEMTLPKLRETYFAARRAMIKRCADKGMTQTEAAKALGVSPSYLNRFASDNGINWPVIRPGNFGPRSKGKAA